MLLNCRYICPTKCSCYRNQDSSLQIVDCSNRNLTVIPELPTITTVADLDGNEFGEIPALSFQNNSRLKILSLNNSNIEVIHDKAFAGLSGLQSLWLDNNIIQDVSSGAFFGLENVKNISLHANSIEILKAGAFDRAKSVNNLTLHGNKLQMVDLKTFMAKNVNLTRLTLSENPWLCNCSFGPGFQEWIRRKIKIIRDANDIECQDNETAETNNATDVRQSYKFLGNFVNESQGSNTVNETLKQLLYVNFSHCYPNRSKVFHQSNKKAVIALSVSGCLFLLMLTVALSVYCSREIIKVCLYNRYGFRFNKQDERNDGKQFDAFVSYSQQDQKFVTKALVPKLEQKKPYYHLCLHYRDWPIGGAIAQTICESVEKSRRTIILLSENFMKSEWCQYEFKAAHYRVLHDKTIRIIMILLDDKPPQNLDPELKLYIKTNTYLEWKDPWFWEKLKYALPDVEREPRPKGRAYYQYMAGKPVNEDTERENDQNIEDTDASDVSADTNEEADSSESTSDIEECSVTDVGLTGKPVNEDTERENDQNIEDTDASDVSADTNEETDSSESTSDIEECSVTDVGLTNSFELDEVRIVPNTATTTGATEALSSCYKYCKI